jgi:hypothetical protein
MNMRSILHYLLGIIAALSVSAAIGGAPSDRDSRTVTVPLEEPEIVRLSSTKYLVKCRSGKEHTLTLDGSQESASAGPKNAYVLGRARGLCEKSLSRAK